MRLKKTAALLCAWTLSAGLLFAQSVSNPNTVTVSSGGTGANFSDLQSALNSITTASATNPYVILVYPGIYTGSRNGGNLTWKSYVSLRGVERTSTIIAGSSGGSGPTPPTPLINLTGVTGVEISNITFDGSAVNASAGGDEVSGGAAVCGATVTFNNVTYTSSGGTANGTSLVSGVEYGGQTCTGGGSVTVRNSDMVTIVDAGGDWLITNSRLHQTGSNPNSEVFAFVVVTDNQQHNSGGTKTIIGSTLEITAAGTSLISPVADIYIAGIVPGTWRIIGSNLIANTTVAAPAFDTAAVYATGGSGSLLIEGSSITYQSVTGATSGEYFGIYSPIIAGFPIDVRGSIIRSIGSGGTRADVDREGTAAITLAGVDYSTVAGAGASGIITADLRQGQFSSDLTIPLAPPATAANGKLFVNSSNQLCYRSGGALYCVAGGGFMKVAQIGTSPASGNLVCVTVGTKREGQAAVKVVNRDTGAVVVGATVTGNWSGATTQNGVTAVTDATGNATLTSAQANKGLVFTFTVTNVTHSPDSYDASSNVETSDSTPVCN